MSYLKQLADGANLYVSSEVPPGSDVTMGYLLPTGTVGPAQLTLAEALGTYTGWFVVIPGTNPDTLGPFAAAAQVFFANSARLGALFAWFQDISNPVAGLNGEVLYASRNGTNATLTRTAQIQGANLSVNINAGSTIAVSSDGLSLAIAGTGNSLSVTPFGARQPARLPWTDGGSISVLGPSALSGCFLFGISVNETAADQMDIGLRSYTAPAGGGYAQTALHRTFAFGTTGLPISVTLDPVALLNHTRSCFTFAAGQTALGSTLRTAVGAPVELTPTADSALVFTNRLMAVDASGNPVVLPNNQVCSVAPSGSFTVTLPDAKQSRLKQDGAAPDVSSTLMCGLSAVEYLDVVASASLTFVPDQAAFAPTVQEASSTTGTKRIFGPLTAAGQTSWAYLSEPGGSSYFAQPDSSVLHNGKGDATAPFLNYLPVLVGTLPATLEASTTAGSTATGYPLLPYADVSVGPGLSTDDLAQFELQAWAPARRSLIQGAITLGAKSASSPTESLPAPPYGTTPQGLLLEFEQVGSTLGWAHLTLGNSPSTVPQYRSNTVIMSSVDGPLKEALQTNQLALIVSGSDQFAACGSFPYVLTQERYLTLQTVITDPAVIAAIAPLVTGVSAGSGMWPDEQALNQSLLGVLTTAQYAEWGQTVRSYTGDFSLFVADWEFDLSPWRWVDHNSIVIFKFCRKQLVQVVGDISQWTQARDFNVTPPSTQSLIADIFSEATERLKAGDTDLSYFVNTVMLDPNWNGILVLNAEVPLSGLPPQLEGLAAGIDASQFQAHHLGITVTPVVTGATQYSTTGSSAFGLIDYNSPDPISSSDPYDFKVLSLKVRIANSDIASFSSTIEILINQLFGEATNQQNASDNNLVLYGAYQKSGGVGTYSFTSNGATSYSVVSSTLYMVNIETASFITVNSNDINPDDTTVVSRFQLNGSISFLPLTGFDAFSYGPEQAVINDGGIGGGLSYSALSIDMTFDQATPTYRNFVFDAGKIILDQQASISRVLSLASHFPMKLVGLIQASGDTTPDSLGFMPVDTPVQGSQLTAPWFGLQFELDLGSLGALAAEAGFTAKLLLAWAPNPQSPTIYVGLALPGVSGGDRAISLQGVLKLVFGDVSFLVQPPTYILQLKNIALKFLSLSFPPNGQINMLIFGNPDAQTSGALGWYAAYLKNGAGTNKSSGIKGVGRLKIADAERSLLVAPQHIIKKPEVRK